MHFAITYRKALGSGVFFSDKRRNRIKSLDEYYHIRAKITCDSIAKEVLIQSKPREVKNGWRSRSWVLILVALLVLAWILLILSVTTNIFEGHSLSLETILSPFSFVTSGIWHMITLPVTLPMAIYETVTSQAGNAINSIFHPTHVKRTAFVGRRKGSELNRVLSELAVGRASRNLAVHHKAAFSNALATTNGDDTKLEIFDTASKGLLNLAALVDDGSTPQLTVPTPNDNQRAYVIESHLADQGETTEAEEGTAKEGDESKKRAAELQAAESKLKPLQEYATGVTFEPKLDERLYLVGAGVRKKSIVKVYAVAIYSSAAVLKAAESRSMIGKTARTFGSSTPMTSFVLEMVYSVSAEKIAGAIGESVKPRYNGAQSDITTLESLIVQGVNKIGGQATKGTAFRFDCSREGVSVTVDGTVQGMASFRDLGSAFVDVFMDNDAVSPTLVDSCLYAWSTSEAKALSSSLLELTQDVVSEDGDGDSAEENDGGADAAMQQAIETQMKPIQDYATGVTFEPKLDESLYLIGVGVRKKSIVKVYAVGVYSSASVIEALSQSKDTSTALRSAARTFSPSTPTTSFVLEMVYSAGAEKIAGAIAESVKPRYGGSPSDINVLESLIIEGVNRKGGQASKGTVFRFDCSEKGVSVSVDGSLQGMADFDGLGSAFVDVFMDENAVSPTLVDSCLNTWTAVSH